MPDGTAHTNPSRRAERSRPTPRLAGDDGIVKEQADCPNVVLFAYGIWPYTERFTALWDVRQLSALVERHARGGSVAAFGGRWFLLDFGLPSRILGWSPKSVTTLSH